MQEEVLKLVLLALEEGSALSRKVLVMFVVQRLEPQFPQASKTSIGHVVPAELFGLGRCIGPLYFALFGHLTGCRQLDWFHHRHIHLGRM